MPNKGKIKRKGWVSWRYQRQTNQQSGQHKTRNGQGKGRQVKRHGGAAIFTNTLYVKELCLLRLERVCGLGGRNSGHRVKKESCGSEKDQEKTERKRRKITDKKRGS